MEKKQYELQDDRHPDFWRFIGYSPKSFFKQMETVIKHLRQQKIITNHPANRVFVPGGPSYLTFLDLGCGVGNILNMAEAYYEAKRGQKKWPVFHALGVEHDKHIAYLARQATHTCYDANIRTEDIRKTPDKIIQQADIVYYYWPLKQRKEMNKFEAKLAKTITPKTILITNDCYFFHDKQTREHYGIEKITTNGFQSVYQKL